MKKESFKGEKPVVAELCCRRMLPLNKITECERDLKQI